MSEAQKKVTKESSVKTTKKMSLPETRKGRLIVYIVAILLIVFITNPSLIPFSGSLGENLTRAMRRLLGDVTQIAKVVTINWITLFQLVLMVIALLLVKEIVTWILEKIQPKTSRGMTVKTLIESLMQYIFALVGIFWGLSIIGVNVSTIFASLGIMALIIGFGAESLIADVVTGLFMIFENHYNVGDVIELDGFRGKIVNISIRTTSVEDDGNIKIFNNSDMRNILNYSSDTSYAVCDIPIPYEADLEKAEKVLETLFDELFKENPEIFKSKPYYKGVQELATDAVVLRIEAEVDEYVRFKAARIMNRKCKIGLEKAGMGRPHEDFVVHKAE